MTRFSHLLMQASSTPGHNPVNNVQWEVLQKTQKRIYQKTAIEQKPSPRTLEMKYRTVY